MNNPYHKWQNEIGNHLSVCNKANTPGIYNNIQTREGYKKIENLIIAVVIVNGISIEEGINRVEAGIKKY